MFDVPFVVTAEMLDRGAFGGAVFVSLCSAVWRVVCGEGWVLNRFMTDIFNGAAIVPLMALIVGLFDDGVWLAATQSNRVLIALACFVALLSVLRSIFGSIDKSDKRP